MVSICSSNGNLLAHHKNNAAGEFPGFYASVSPPAAAYTGYSGDTLWGVPFAINQESVL